MGSDAPNAVLLQKNHCSQTQKRQKKRSKKRSRTLEKRSRNALGIGQRSVSMHFTNIDDGVASSQQVGEGASPSLGVPARRAKRQKVTRGSK